MGYQEFIDREGRPLLFTWYDTTSAPAGLTVRFTYTVPVGKAAVIAMRSASICNRTIATTANIVRAYHRSNLSGGGLKEVLLAQSQLVLDSSHVEIAHGYAGPILAGDVLDGVTLDSSTGGFKSYQLGLEVLEYDRKIT